MDVKPILMVGIATGASGLITYFFTQDREKTVIVSGIAGIAAILTQVISK